MAQMEAVVNVAADWLGTAVATMGSGDDTRQLEWDVPVLRVFPAFGGVLCIALRGFPSSVPCLKAQLVSALDSEPRCVGLAPENLGSMWPKITIAAPSANVSTDAADWDRLRQALLSFHTAPDMRVRFDRVSLVTFRNRALESHREVAHVSTADVDAFCAARNASTEPDAGLDSASEGRVASIVGEYLDEAAWPAYRDAGILQRMQRAEAYLSETAGATLVSFVVATEPFTDMLRDLKAHLADCGCGGMFEWMPATALHMTVRGLL